MICFSPNTRKVSISCAMTMYPSAEICKSVSITSQPASTAAWKADTVFSGYDDLNLGDHREGWLLVYLSHWSWRLCNLMSVEMAPKSAESNIHTPYALRSVVMSYLVLNVVACGHQMNQCTTRQNSPSQPAEEQVKKKD